MVMMDELSLEAAKQDGQLERRSMDFYYQTLKRLSDVIACHYPDFEKDLGI